MKKTNLFLSLLLFATLSSCGGGVERLRESFNEPAADCYPMPFWHINGEMTEEQTALQIAEAAEANCGGVTFLPVYGIKPDFLSDDYFDHCNFVLDELKKHDMQFVLYDDISFPSGTAGGQFEREFPDNTRKRLDKVEYETKGSKRFSQKLPEGKVMSIVAENKASKEKLNITDSAKDGLLSWDAPAGDWRVMAFMLVKDVFHKKYLVMDLLDSTAVNNFISLTYDKYAEHFGDRFGNQIQYTFFDDVGFLRAERTWTASFNDKFEELYGYNPEIYYPALWEELEESTWAIRSAFFNTRAELLAEGFMKHVTNWTDSHGLQTMGHPPGNYDPMPVDMNGDIFKYYRYQHIPLMDVIIDYGFGRDGHKMVSSAADFYDRPVVGAEIYGAITMNGATFDTNLLYRVAMETFSRGANFIVPHGMWYTDKIQIQPLVSMRNPVIADELPTYGEYVARMSSLLRGGRRVADIALMYPINDLQGWYRFESPDNTGRKGSWISPTVDYLEISDDLTRFIHRDFTFVHPEFLVSDKYEVGDGVIKLLNEENYQDYKIVIMPGQHIMSIEALKRIKEFYDRGGKVIATTMLPYQSYELGQDEEVKAIVKEMFAPKKMENKSLNVNENGGIAIYLPDADLNSLRDAIDAVDYAADVVFTSLPDLSEEEGVFSYLHKVKDGVDIYYFANSSDKAISTVTKLRGEYKVLELWNPLDGDMQRVTERQIVYMNNEAYTIFNLELDPVSSVVAIGK